MKPELQLALIVLVILAAMLWPSESADGATLDSAPPVMSIAH